jgi:hypothetical protein
MRKLLIMTCIVLALFPQSIADVLLKSGEPIRKGKGKEEGSKINWVNCNGKPENFDNSKKEYSIQPGNDCQIPKPQEPARKPNH